MYVLQQIYAAAIETPEKLALAYNGRAISYGEFWRLIDGRRRSLDPHVPESGIAVLAMNDLLEAWLDILALRSLGLDTAVVRTAEEAALFDGLNVACVITLDEDPRPEIPTPPGARRLRLTDPAGRLASTAEPLPPQPNLREPGGHILLTSGTTGRSKKFRTTSGSEPDALLSRRQRNNAVENYKPTDQDTVACLFSLGLWTAAGHSQPIFIWSQRGAVVIHQGDDYHRALHWPGLTHATVTPYNLSWLMSLPEDAFPAHPEMQLAIAAGSITPALWRETCRRLTSRITISLASTEVGGWGRTMVETEEDLRWYKVDRSRKVEVVDDAGFPLPPGKLGRVRVALRDHQAHGYFEDPQATAVFYEGDWFYPGDLAVLDDQGRISLHGRTTDIIHIKGDKYPAEPWERAIQEKLECEAVCIISGRWGTDDERLHVFIESRRPISANALNAALRETLFGFANAQVHRVSGFPRTKDTGKIMRRVLAQQLHDRSVGTAEPQSAAASVG